MDAELGFIVLRRSMGNRLAIVRGNAIKAAAELDWMPVVIEAALLLEDEDPEVRILAADAIFKLTGKKFVPAT